jgi:hypothetical protein
MGNDIRTNPGSFAYFRLASLAIHASGYHILMTASLAGIGFARKRMAA